MLPLSVRIGTAPLSVIVDAAFALSPIGLLATMTMARTARVWLPRRMLALLDNDRLYRHAPARMGGSWLAAERREAALCEMAQELELWHRAWSHGRLASRVFFVGDAHYESALAECDDRSLLSRFERCAAALDDRLSQAGHLPDAPLDECARDAVALAAALQPETVAIVTLAEADGEAPLCRMLRTLGFDVRSSSLGLGIDDLLDPALAPLADRGLAALRILAPGALALADGWDDEPWDSEGEDDPSDQAGAWRNARALWRPIAAGGAA